MSTFQGTDRQKQRIELAINEGMRAFAHTVWKDEKYDIEKDPEDIRSQVRSVVMVLVYRGWIDFS